MEVLQRNLYPIGEYSLLYYLNTTYYIQMRTGLGHMGRFGLGAACSEEKLRPRSSAEGRHFGLVVYFYKEQILELYNSALVALN